MSRPRQPWWRRIDVEKLSPRNWSLRIRLAVVLLVPGVLALVLSGLRIADQIDDVADRNRVERSATAQNTFTTLVERVQQERIRSAAYVAGRRTGDLPQLRATYAEIDATRVAVRKVVEELYDDDPRIAGVDRQAEQALDRLPQLRTLVVESNAPPSAAISRYSELIGQLVQLDDTLLRVDSSDVTGLAGGLAGLTAARNEASLQLALITSASGTGARATDALVGLQDSDARLVNGLADFRVALDPGQRVRFGALVAGASNAGRSQFVQRLERAGSQPLPAATAVDAAVVYSPFLDEIDTAGAGMRAELAATNAASEQRSVDAAGLNAVLLVLALLIGSTVVGLIASTMIKSLRTLRRSALEVAETRLPEAVARMRGGAVPDVNIEPVPVTSREEVGEVARAFDAVHLQAVRLAAEQATLQSSVNSMFINLSRRSQSLVDRQLQLIEELEGNEQDPDQLSNLFRLDHLATRMRRNGENLLVLAGTDLAKRSSRPVPVIDVMQAAVSEVEQYERVIVEQVPLVAVVGRAANDVQHLLAELLDNATSFSAPDTQVIMRSSRISNGPLVIEITDRGVGMKPQDLAAVNRRLGLPGELNLNTSRRMGLFVVGRLASRHGVQVRLVNSSGLSQDFVQRGARKVVLDDPPGLTARVTIPGHLAYSTAEHGDLVEPPARSEPRPPAHPDAAPASRSALPWTGSPSGPPPRSEPATPAMPVPRVEHWPAATVPADAAAGAPVSDRTWPVPVEARHDDSTPAGAFVAVPRQRDDPAVPRQRHDPAERARLDVSPETGPLPLPTAIRRLPTSAGARAGLSPDPDRPDEEENTSSWFRSYREVPINWVPAPDGEAVPFADVPRESPPPAARDAAADAGLPRRQPGARLVRGADPLVAPRPVRNPDAVRERLAGYQRGRENRDQQGTDVAEDRIG